MKSIRILVASAFLAPALFGIAACSKAPAEPSAVTGGDWTVDSDVSSLSYVSVKSGNVAEANTFSALSGSVSEAGEAEVIIDLASLETGVDIRNERMRDIFFVVADNPTANVTATIDPATFEALGVGESMPQKLDATLSVKGVETSINADVQVTRAGEDRVQVVSTAPVIVYADALELTEGLATLQQLAGLGEITPLVPVTFSLTFKR
ncbi:MAG: YceI family protein [Pseudomonadota bacterium]